MDLKSTTDSFEKSVCVLSQAVNYAGIRWSDPKYFELKSGISQLAFDSKAVVEAGRRAESALAYFYFIAAEV